MQIAFIGGGVMAEAMIRAIIDNGLTTPNAITASDIDPMRCAALSQGYGIKTTRDNREALERGEVVVLAIKPQALNGVIDGLRGLVRSEQLVLSIVAGASTATISKGLRHSAVVRVMPNLPAQIGEGVSVWTATSSVTEAQKESVAAILRALGKEIYLTDEKYLDMATAVSGSGPAYVFLVIESLIEAAVHIGLPREVAGELVLQTVLGSVHFMEKSGKHPAELRNMVTSPGGTTAEGLFELEEGGLRALIMKAIIAGYEKAKKLSGLSEQ